MILMMARTNANVFQDASDNIDDSTWRKWSMGNNDGVLDMINAACKGHGEFGVI